MVVISIIYIFMIKRKEMHIMQFRSHACKKYDLKRKLLKEMKIQGYYLNWVGRRKKPTPAQVLTDDKF